MLMNSSFTNEPAKVMIEKHGSEAWIWLRRNIKEVEAEDGPQFECEEAFFKTGSSISEGDILSDFDTYFEFASTYIDNTKPVSLEERISDLEDAVLAMMGV